MVLVDNSFTENVPIVNLLSLFPHLYKENMVYVYYCIVARCHFCCKSNNRVFIVKHQICTKVYLPTVSHSYILGLSAEKSLETD